MSELHPGQMQWSDGELHQPEPQHQEVAESTIEEAETEADQERQQQLGESFNTKEVKVGRFQKNIPDHLHDLASEAKRLLPTRQRKQELQTMVVSLFPESRDRHLLLCYYKEQLEEIRKDLDTPRMTQIAGFAHNSGYEDYQNLVANEERATATIQFLEELELEIAKEVEILAQEKIRLVKEYEEKDIYYDYGGGQHLVSTRIALREFSRDLEKINPADSRARDRLIDNFTDRLYIYFSQGEIKTLITALKEAGRVEEAQNLELFI